MSEETEVDIPESTGKKRAEGLRLRRIIILETVLVALGGFTVWGLLWEMGFPRVGLGIAIVLWLTISPVIEIATVMKYRRSEAGDED